MSSRKLLEKKFCSNGPLSEVWTIIGENLCINQVKITLRHFVCQMTTGQGQLDRNCYAKTGHTAGSLLN
jgi:hypothetical protein